VKPKLLIGILIVLIVLNVATISSFFYANSQMKQREHSFPRLGAPPEAPRPDGPPDMPPAEPIRLNAEERVRLMNQLQEFYEDTAELRRRVRDLETTAFALMERDSVPRAELDSILAEISDVRLEMRRFAVDKLIESKAHLTPHQQKHFFRAILESGSDRGYRMGRSARPHRDGGRSGRR
jgi:uncharacterized membrane protein